MAARQYNDDLFEESRMTFGEHLEELRICLIRALLGVGVGTIIGFIFAEQVVVFLEGPLKAAMNDYRINRAVARLSEGRDYLDPELKPWIEERRMAPREIFIDPGELVRALREVSPSSFEHVDLKPYRFTVLDVPADSVDEICRRLAAGNDGDEDQARLDAVWGLLSPEDQAVVRRIGQSGPATDQDRQQLTEILNRLADQPPLHQSAAFAPWMAAPMRRWYQLFSAPEPNPLHFMQRHWQQTQDPDLSRRLNRVILVKLFPDQLVLPAAQFVSLDIWETVDFNPQALAPHESFMIWLKAAIFAGVILASPWVFYQVWVFVAAGLYPHEKHYVYIYLPISLVLFVSGILLAFFFVIKPVLDFLFKFNAGMGIDPQTRIGEWLSFVMFLPLGFGIAFQLPLVMLFLNLIGIFDVKAYLNKWRIAVMIIFVLSMILTPADPMSMILMAIPLTVLYFFGIALCHWMPGAGNRRAATYGPS